jgi:hypothetical protein
MRARATKAGSKPVHNTWFGVVITSHSPCSRTAHRRIPAATLKPMVILRGGGIFWSPSSRAAPGAGKHWQAFPPDVPQPGPHVVVVDPSHHSESSRESPVGHCRA